MIGFYVCLFLILIVGIVILRKVKGDKNEIKS